MSEEATLDDFSGQGSEIAGEEETKEVRNSELPTVPNDWEVSTIGKIISDEENAFTDGARYSLSSAEIHENGEVRAILLEEVGEGEFNDGTPKFATQEKYEEITHRAIYPGEVVVAKMAEPVARACIVPDTYERYLLGCADVVRIVPNQEVDGRFLMYCMNSYKVWRQAVAQLRGTGRSRINLENISELKIPKPSLKEQRKIATVLSTVDQAIQKTEEIIEQEKIVRKAVAQDSLILETNSYTRPTEWGKIPASWNERTLEDVCKLITDGTHMPPERTKEGIPLIGIDEIDGIQLNFSSGSSCISQDDYDQMTNSNKPDTGDVLIAVVGATIGKSAIVTREEPFAIQRSLGLLRTNESVLPQFLHTVVQSPNFKRQLDTRARATAQAGVYLEELKRLQIPVPPIEEQQKIADRVETITFSIRKESEYLDKLNWLKQGLMQDLFSGTVRTHETDIEIPEAVLAQG